MCDVTSGLRQVSYRQRQASGLSDSQKVRRSDSQTVRWFRSGCIRTIVLRQVVLRSDSQARWPGCQSGTGVIGIRYCGLYWPTTDSQVIGIRWFEGQVVRYQVVRRVRRQVYRTVRYQTSGIRYQDVRRQVSGTGGQSGIIVRRSDNRWPADCPSCTTIPLSSGHTVLIFILILIHL
jgi:hypothetical protein